MKKIVLKFADSKRKIVLKTADSKRPLNEGQVIMSFLPKRPPPKLPNVNPQCAFCGHYHLKNRCPQTPF